MQSLAETAWFSSENKGKAYILSLKKPHLVLSTSQINGGIQRKILKICNLQSCEGKHHDSIAKSPLSSRSEKENFIDFAQHENLDSKTCVFMGTAANMNYAMLGKASWQDLAVHAIATAGVQANATRAGDPAKYYELDGKWQPCPALAGTINIILHINHPLSEAAITRCAMTLTEAKTAVLMDLGVGSLNSSTLATGTGTDQFVVAASEDDSKTALTWSGAHTKLGECIGKAVYNAVKTALEWQNGLDAKRCRGLYHQLKRFKFKPEDWIAWLQPHLKESEIKFFEANKLAIEYDLHVSNAVAAISHVLDRQRCGYMTSDVALQQSKHLCTLMVVQIASCIEAYQDIFDSLKHENETFSVLAKAIVIAWRKKWS